MESKLSFLDYILLFAVVFGVTYYGVMGLLTKILLTCVPQVGVSITDTTAPMWAVIFASELAAKVNILIALLVANAGLTYFLYKMIRDLKKEVNK